MFMALLFLQSWGSRFHIICRQFTCAVGTLGFHHEVPFRVNTFGSLMPGLEVRSDFLNGNCFRMQEAPDQGWGGTGFLWESRDLSGLTSLNPHNPWLLGVVCRCSKTTPHHSFSLSPDECPRCPHVVSKACPNKHTNVGGRGAACRFLAAQLA